MNMGDNKLLIFLIAFLFIMPLCFAEVSLPPEKVGTCIRLVQSHPNVTSINVTSILYPNSSQDLTIKRMNTSSGNNVNYYYDFCDTQQTGKYIATTCGNGDGVKTCMDYSFLITGNGEEPPDGIVITLFILFFIILLLFTTYVIIYSIGHAVKLDFDVIDLAWNYGVFFILVGLKIAEEAYLGNVAIENYLGWTINIGIWVLMILPTIYFILTLTIGTILSKRIKGVDY
jgi:hypothetical protein